MKKISLRIKGLITFSLASFILSTQSVKAQLTENFDNITTLTGAGWFMQNNSVPVGTSGWFQGNPAAFVAFNGATDSYIGANFNNTTGANTISNWLVTPNFTLKNGDVLTFYTRTTADNMWADRLQVRMSTNGASTNVGVGSAAVGDFTNLLLDINPSLLLSTYPMVWTQFTVVISGLPAPTSGRLAFRYFVTNGGPSGANSDYIGIDNVVHTPYVCPTLTVGPGGLANGTAGTAYNQTLSQTGALGAPAYAVTAGALPPGLTLSVGGAISGTPTATGTFNFTVTVADASGCSGSQAMSITIVCPTGGASLSSFPTLCGNGAPYVLTQGSPAGGTYSGTGVTGGSFDPTFGAQTITYTVIDAYGCTQVANGNISVNAPPSVSFPSLGDICDNIAPFALTGGSPVGGSYSGTGVTAGNFNPAVGTQTITYTYTDGNGCSNSASQVQTVLVSPTVTLNPFTPICNNSAPVTLAGGSPAGGVYSGIGVSGGSFNPALGTQTVAYTFTAANGCVNSANQVYTVNPAPTVTLSSFSSVCEGSAAFTLTGGSPASGTYSGTGVSGGMFNPTTQGTFTITYSFTDVNGCIGFDTENITVDDCSGITETNDAQHFDCYPNPTNGHFTLQFTQVSAGDIQVRILNAEGKEVLNDKREGFSGTYVRNMDLSNLVKGIYVVEVKTDRGIGTRKIILQ